MDVSGFELSLEDFCDYCPDFEVEVDSCDCTGIGHKKPKAVHFISCKHRKRCKRIAENLKVKCKDE